MAIIIPNSGFQAQVRSLCSKGSELYLGETDIRVFPNLEIKPQINTDVSDKTVILYGSCEGSNNKTPGDKILEFLFLADAAKRSGATKVGAILPFLPYSPQDKAFLPGEPVSSHVIVKLLESSEIDEFWVVDIHNIETLNCFTKKVHHLSAIDLFAKYGKELMLKEPADKYIVAAMDKGSLARNKYFAELLGLELVLFDKSRDKKTGEVTFHSLQGDVTGKVVFSFDDYTSTGATQIKAYEYLKNKGAKAFYTFISHIIVEGVIERLVNANIDAVITTNSTCVHAPEYGNVTIMDIADIIVPEIESFC
jgi:ribose-phosphate pyrophosphokinase